jgi:hypothetical protein
LGFGAVDAVAALTPFPAEVPLLVVVDLAGAEFAEPDADLSVVELGPATPPVVSDVLEFRDTACVVEPVSLVFAADADLVPPLLQAQAVMAIETRTERYIFPKLYPQ